MAEKTVYIIDLNDKVTGKLKGVQNEAKKTDSAFQGIGNTINLLGIGVGIGTLGTLAKGIYDITSAAEQTRIQFEVMLGSASKADTMIRQIREFAAATPFETQDLEQATSTMLGFGIAAEDIMPNIKMLGDVAGGNADKFGRIVYAFSQVSATGRLMGQDLLQLINAGFNPLQTISEKTGIKLSVLKKKMEDGAISAEMVKGAFQIETSEGGRFFGMMEKQSQTLAGRMGTLVDNIKMVGLEMGNTAQGGMKQFVEYGIQAVDVVKDTAWTDFFSALGDSVLLFKGFGEFFAKFGEFGNSMFGLQYVIDTVTVSVRSMLFVVTGIFNTWEAIALTIRSIPSFLGGNFEGGAKYLDAAGLKISQINKNFNGITDFEGGRGFGESENNATTRGGTKRGFDPNSFKGYLTEGAGVDYKKLYDDLLTGKTGKNTKQGAGGMTLNESKNGSTVITFNIDTFQKNEFSKDGTNINNNMVKDFLDQMARGLGVVLNDAAIIAKQ
jgi:tape measure domain-containing protein